jgi:hypothetical protein
MPTPEILKQIDAEIARLKRALHILAGRTSALKTVGNARFPQNRASGSAKTSVDAGPKGRCRWSPSRAESSFAREQLSLLLLPLQQPR